MDIRPCFSKISHKRKWWYPGCKYNFLIDGERGQAILIADKFKTHVVSVDENKNSFYVFEDEKTQESFNHNPKRIWTLASKRQIVCLILGYKCKLCTKLIKRTDDLNQIKVLKKIKFRSSYKCILMYLRGMLYDPNFSGSLNKNDHLLPCNDGTVINLKDGTCRILEKEDLFSIRCNAHLPTDDEFDTTNVYKYINPIFCYDQEKVEYMLHRIASYLCGELDNEIDIWVGDDCNGKSRLSYIIRDLMGDLSCFPSNDIFIKHPRSNTILMRQYDADMLMNKRIGFSLDLHKNYKYNFSLLNELISGNPIAVSKGMCDFLQPKIKLVLVCGTNQLPIGFDRKFMSSVNFIQFKAKFNCYNNNIDEKNFLYAANKTLVEQMFTQKELCNLLRVLVPYCMKFYKNQKKVIDAPLSIISDNIY